MRRRLYATIFLMIAHAPITCAQVAAPTAKPPADTPQAIDPACTALRNILPTLKPMQALIELERFQVIEENSIGCSGSDITHWISENEQKLVRLIDTQGSLSPQTTLRCYQINLKNTHCQGTEADDTQFINEGWFPRQRHIDATAAITIQWDIPNTTLIGLFRAKPVDLWSGKRATPIAVRQGKFNLAQPDKDTVVIAILRLKGEWVHWPYRKVVWFF